MVVGSLGVWAWAESRVGGTFGPGLAVEDK